MLELTKPRLSLMSVISAVVGYLAAQPTQSLSAFFSLLGGTALAAAGAAALNQWLEQDSDGRMARTAGRPLPAGNLDASTALLFGLSLSVGGTAVLYFGTNLWAALLCALTVVSYTAVYTPLKKWTPWSTEIGAVSGALPPLLGWVAATGSFDFLGWVLFSLLFFWQMTHFMAICWTHREDYCRGGFAMLSSRDPGGARVARKALFYAVALCLLPLLPLIHGSVTWFYFLAVAPANLWFLARAVDFQRQVPRDLAAQRLFRASIAHLPIVLLLLVADRYLA